MVTTVYQQLEKAFSGTDLLASTYDWRMNLPIGNNICNALAFFSCSSFHPAQPKQEGTNYWARNMGYIQAVVEFEGKIVFYFISIANEAVL